ncbi:54S ribosomal protein L49, mitochondrial [Coemansia sp. RSA 530]|nr:54S ribosomal protein L49, mitochondrial [Coemansia sp. RSA 530]KAJ2836817.1 54S ribosomal protein L49, mitochondrial [Coemansia erecta]
MFKLLTTRTATRAQITSRLIQNAFESTTSTAPIEQVPRFVTYEYFLARTTNMSLPVYLEVKKNKAVKHTLLQRIEGDISKLRQELSDELGISPSKIRVKPPRAIKITGDHTEAICEWLTAKGF